MNDEVEYVPYEEGEESEIYEKVMLKIAEFTEEMVESPTIIVLWKGYYDIIMRCTPDVIAAQSVFEHMIGQKTVGMHGKIMGMNVVLTPKNETIEVY